MSLISYFPLDSGASTIDSERRPDLVHGERPVSPDVVNLELQRYAQRSVRYCAIVVHQVGVEAVELAVERSLLRREAVASREAELARTAACRRQSPPTMKMIMINGMAAASLSS